MSTRKVEPTDDLDRFVDTEVDTEQDEQARTKWLRAAVQVAVDEIDRGEGIAFETMDDLRAYIHTLGEEAAAELAAERKSG